MFLDSVVDSAFEKSIITNLLLPTRLIIFYFFILGGTATYFLETLFWPNPPKQMGSFDSSWQKICAKKCVNLSQTHSTADQVKWLWSLQASPVGKQHLWNHSPLIAFPETLRMKGFLEYIHFQAIHRIFMSQCFWFSDLNTSSSSYWFVFIICFLQPTCDIRDLNQHCSAFPPLVSWICLKMCPHLMEICMFFNWGGGGSFNITKWCLSASHSLNKIRI